MDSLKPLHLALVAAFASVAAAAGAPTFTFALPDVVFDSIAIDSQGNTYLAGTSGHNIPTTPGAFQANFTPQVCGVFMFPVACQSAFVMKLTPSGAVVWATYLNGSYASSAYGLAVDGAGNVYVAGWTSSADFPVTAGAAFPSGNFNAGYLRNGFLAKLNAAGSALIYSTLIPNMTPLALAIDGAGNAYVSGFASAGFAATSGAYQTAPRNPSQPYSGAVIKLNPGGSAAVWATFLCGTVPLGNGDSPNAIAVDALGNVAVAGWTAAPDFPVTTGAVRPAPPDSKSTFLSVLNPAGSRLLFSTYLSAGNNRAPGVRFDSAGGVYVLAEGGSFPVTTGAYLATPGGPFLAHFTAAGTLDYATYLPFQTGIDGEAMDLDSPGNVVLAGTAAPGLPATSGALQAAAASAGGLNGYILKFSPDHQLLGATYLGGSARDDAFAIAAAPNGSVVVAGTATSRDFPGMGSLPASASEFGFATSLFPALTVQNAADFRSAAIVPGEIVAIRGYGIGPSTGQIAQPAGSLPVALAGVSVTFGGLAAPLFYVQDQQVNAQVPWEIAGQTPARVEVRYQAGGSTRTAGPVSEPLAPSTPGIFYVNNSDGSTNSAAHPASPGDFLSLYGTGGGATNPPGVTGALWPLTPSYPLLALPVSITIGGENASVLYAGASPLNWSGVFQVNVLIPADLPASPSAVLLLKIGTAASLPVSVALK